jgi:hypothetical protein
MSLQNVKETVHKRSCIVLFHLCETSRVDKSRDRTQTGTQQSAGTQGRANEEKLLNGKGFHIGVSEKI